MPIERHNRQVCVAHERLADIVYAVVCMAAKIGDADIVQVMPQDLSKHAQTMKMMVCTDLTEETAPVAQLDGLGILSSVQFLHFLCSEAEVIVLEEMGPCIFYLRARLASEFGAQTETPIERVSVVTRDGILCRCCDRQTLVTWESDYNRLRHGHVLYVRKGSRFGRQKPGTASSTRL